jgi:transposase
MSTALFDDEPWKLIEPLVPARKRRFRHPGRKRLDDRRTLAGILLMLRTGIAWQQLPQELAYGSGMTCWRPPTLALPRRPRGCTRRRRSPSSDGSLARPNPCR